MRMIGLLCGVIAVAALSGCNTMPTMNGGAAGGVRMPADTYKCTLNDDCIVTVKVTPVGENSCSISLDPNNDLEMNSGGLSMFVSHLIRWVLDDSSQDMKFRFADTNAIKGVVLKDPSTDPNNKQFFKQKATNGGREYQWRDQNSNTHGYEYAINIVQKGTNRSCKLDPRIWNN
jgi:hypothetical protein